MRRGLGVAVMLAVGLGGSAEAGKRKRKGKRKGPTVSAPAPPSARAVREAGPAPRSPRPGLSVPDRGLDIRSMRRTVTRFSLDVPPMDPVDPSLTDAVALQLAADPRWRLSAEEGVLVGSWREDDGGDWVVGPGGFHDDGARAWRVRLRLGVWPAGHRWTVADGVVHGAASGATVQLQPVSETWEPWSDRLATALSVDGEGFGFDVYEAGDGESLPYTVGAAEDVMDWWGRAVMVADRVAAAGPGEAFLPPGEPGTPGAGEVAFAEGILTASARVNPGLDGWTWLRLMDGDGPWQEAAITAGTRERAGYSAEPSEGFWVQSAVPLAEALPEGATAAWWFVADGSETPVWLTDPAPVR